MKKKKKKKKLFFSQDILLRDYYLTYYLLYAPSFSRWGSVLSRICTGRRTGRQAGPGVHFIRSGLFSPPFFCFGRRTRIKRIENNSHVAVSQSVINMYRQERERERDSFCKKKKVSVVQIYIYIYILWYICSFSLFLSPIPLSPSPSPNSPSPFSPPHQAILATQLLGNLLTRNFLASSNNKILIPYAMGKNQYSAGIIAV